MRTPAELNELYFSTPACHCTLPAGAVLHHQGESASRIYLVKSGELALHHKPAGFEPEGLSARIQAHGYETQRTGAGSYINAAEFLAGGSAAGCTAIALEECEVAWVEDAALREQLLPLLLQQQAQTQQALNTCTAQKEHHARQLQRAESACTLAQLTAGIAHELNNAVGVLARRTDFVASGLWEYLEETSTNNALLFSYGIEATSYLPARELRATSRHYERQLGMSQEAAKVLAHLFPDKEDGELLAPHFVQNVNKNFRFWEMGHDLRDMKVAARTATGIVRAVKLLGGGNTSREPGCDVVQSIKDALNLLHNKLKHLNVELDLQEVPSITADTTELLQIWANFIKNANDAMMEAATPNPTVRISTRFEGEQVVVCIANNGPPIAPEHLEKIWQAHFSTKKFSSDYGLGLGLSIVRRIIDGYNATVVVQSDDAETSFTVSLPLTQPEPETTENA